MEDIFTDLADGRKLLKLLEIISGEKLGKPNDGKLRVHMFENVNKCMTFLHSKASELNWHLIIESSFPFGSISCSGSFRKYWSRRYS